jgi:hypothetical protein
MVYAKNSANYQVSIKIIRRIALIIISLLRIKLGGIYEDHRQNTKRYGLFRYLQMKNFIHKSTDGPHNPYSKVYDLGTIKTDFPLFRIVDHFQMWMHAPPLPVHWLPGERILGWHLWVHLVPKQISHHP